MDLQNTFYIIGIIAMLLYILFLIAILALLFFITSKITALYKHFSGEIKTIKSVIEHPREVAAGVGAEAAAAAINTISNKFSGSKNKRRKK